MSQTIVGHTEAFAEASKSRTITMTGRATIGATPDRVEITLGVSSKAETAKDALTLNNVNMNQIISTLKENGVEEKYILTSNFSIHADYQHFKDGRPAQVRGYNVSNTVRVQVQDVKKLGPLLDKVVSAGSNQVHGIRFYVSNAEEIKDKARKKAVERARRKAELYTEAAGVKLGKVMVISESAHHAGNTPVPMARSLKAEATSVPISGGEQQLGVSVTISWELD
ncbi:MAG: SIMPL domain-containing protein [Rhizobiales bacterium]|nr:SIMPL domain-containing protein [Hyphomicrobiales bacterium]